MKSAQSCLSRTSENVLSTHITSDVDFFWAKRRISPRHIVGPAVTPRTSLAYDFRAVYITTAMRSNRVIAVYSQVNNLIRTVANQVNSLSRDQHFSTCQQPL